MTHIKSVWLSYLERYGANMLHWPEQPSDEERLAITGTPEYEQALTVDAALDATDFPALSPHVLERTKLQITAQERALLQSRLFVYIPRSVRFLTLTIGLLGIGMLAGRSMQGTTTQDYAYDYYTMGPAAYSYSYAFDGGNNE